MQIASIIVGAGVGTRAERDVPKQFADLLGRPVIAWSVDALRAHDDISEIIIVADPEWHVWLKARFAGPDLTIVAGGETRTESVQAGLAAIVDAEHVLIHDAARPGLTDDILDALIASLAAHDAAAPALAVVDTLKYHKDATLSTIDRTGLYRIQTPQGFKTSVIADALKDSAADLFDDIQAVEALGAKVALIDGHERLGKITYRQDFDRIARLMAPAYAPPRIGKGFDVHAFGPGDHVTLCGVRIDHDHGLVGHSDADVAWHALTDAILGAAALGDIGDHFPPSDDRWKGAPSHIFLEESVALARKSGWTIGNCDLTLICEHPKVKPHRETMRQTTAEILGVTVDAVSVKATTTERLGFTGRGEGLAAEAVVLLSPASAGS